MIRNSDFFIAGIADTDTCKKSPEERDKHGVYLLSDKSSCGIAYFELPVGGYYPKTMRDYYLPPTKTYASRDDLPVNAEGIISRIDEDNVGSF